MTDLRYALRQLLKSPGFSIVAILTLALGIGANTAVFSLINASLLRPLPYHQSERMLELSENSLKGGWKMPPAYPNVLDWMSRQTSLSSIAYFTVQPTTLRTELETARISAAFVGHQLLSAYAVKPELGRDFNASDDLPGSAPVAILTHQAWKRRFGSDPSLLGKQVSIADNTVTIVGILPENFTPYQNAELLIPVAPFANSLFLTGRMNHVGSAVLARIAPSSNLATVQAELGAIAEALAKEYPSENKGHGISITPLRERLGGGSRASLLLLLGAVGMTLLIACVNIANMLLSRASARSREIAIRSALGAGRGRIIRQLLTESLLLSALGGIAGLLLGLLLFDFMSSLIPWEMRILSGGLSPVFDWRVSLFLLGVTALTGLGFGLLPAFQLSHDLQGSGLTERQGSGSGRRIGGFRIGDCLVVAEVALAAMLMIGAALLLRSLWTLRSEEIGFDSSRLITLKMSNPDRRFGGDAIKAQLFYEEAAQKLGALPGVDSVAITNVIPFGGNDSDIVFNLPDRPMPAQGEFPSVSVRSADPGFFETMHIPLLRGRVFSLSEKRPNVPKGKVGMDVILAAYKDFSMEGVVSKSFAERYWPGQDPIGKHIRLGNAEMCFGTIEIVGVAGDTSLHNFGHYTRDELFLPFRQFWPPIDYGFMIRTRQDPSLMLKTVQTKLRDFSRDDPIYDIELQEKRIEGSISGRQFNSSLFVFFALLASALALVGIYGVLAFSVSRRMREFGIRIALGASNSQILRSVLLHGMLLSSLGIGLGILGALLSSRFIASQLHGISPDNPLTYLATALAVFIATLFACVLPARRATRVDPVIALRSE